MMAIKPNEEIEDKALFSIDSKRKSQRNGDFTTQKKTEDDNEKEEGKEEGEKKRRKEKKIIYSASMWVKI